MASHGKDEGCKEEKYPLSITIRDGIRDINYAEVDQTGSYGEGE